jgi:hypothetical protein
MRTRLTVAAIAAVLLLGGCGDDSDAGEDGATTKPTTPTGPAVVADGAWCAGWQGLVAVQGAYVASPSPETGDAVLAAVEELEALGVPESLDPAGYTELTAVLDDVRASVDPSFTPSVEPSEPADVGDHEGHEGEGEGEGEGGHEGHDASDAPFGVWLAEYCAS